MTKVKISLAFFLQLVLLNACGPSAEEMAMNDKVKMDSLAHTVKEQTLQAIEQEKRKADSLAAAEAEAYEREAVNAYLKQQLSDARTELRLAKERLASIKEFQLGRTKAEKEQQIEAQYKIIQAWEDEIERLAGSISK